MMCMSNIRRSSTIGWLRRRLRIWVTATLATITITTIHYPSQVVHGLAIMKITLETSREVVVLACLSNTLRFLCASFLPRAGWPDNPSTKIKYNTNYLPAVVKSWANIFIEGMK